MENVAHNANKAFPGGQHDQVLLGENAFHLFLVYPSFFSNDQSISMTVLLNCSKSCDRFVNTHEPIADLPPGAGYLGRSIIREPKL